MKKLLFLLILTTLASCHEVPPTAVESVGEDLCALLGEPEKFISKPITVRGAIIGYHEVFLYIPTCCGSDKVAIVEDLDFDKRREIGDRIREAYPDSNEANLQGEIVVSGTLERNDGPQSPALLVHLVYRFRVTKIIEFRADRTLRPPCPNDTYEKTVTAPK